MLGSFRGFPGCWNHPKTGRKNGMLITYSLGIQMKRQHAMASFRQACEKAHLPKGQSFAREWVRFWMILDLFSSDRGTKQHHALFRSPPGSKLPRQFLGWAFEPGARFHVNDEKGWKLVLVISMIYMHLKSATPYLSAVQILFGCTTIVKFKGLCRK